MNQSFYGSINITKLLEELKAKHSGFYKGSDGKVYANCTTWLNEQPDKYGNVVSIKINPSKDKKDIEKAFYLGNLKKSDGPKPIGDNDFSDISLDHIDPVATHPSISNDVSAESSDLPF
jgi:hypothetical protein